MLDAVWWTVATVTTVGHGDVVPTSDIGRVVGVFYMFAGITILGLFITQLRNSLLGKNWLGQYSKKYESKLSKQIERIAEKQDKLFELFNEQIKNLEKVLARKSSRIKIYKLQMRMKVRQNCQTVSNFSNLNMKGC